MKAHDLLDKMAAAEDAFLTQEFLAPVLPGGVVTVRIAGIVCKLRVEGKVEPGLAVLRPVAMDRARVVRPAGLADAKRFFGLFPAVRLVLLSTAGEHKPWWLAVNAHAGDTRIAFDGPARVFLVRDAEPFDTVIARFDGAHFWYEAKDRRRPPALAAYLRDSFRDEVPVAKLRRKQLSAEEREAYAQLMLAAEEARKSNAQLRIERALAHSGAALASFIERRDSFVVRYTVDGQMHTSTVRKDDLTVEVAGICLAGQDARFDLTSLVGVLRQPEATGVPRHHDDDDDDPYFGHAVQR